MESSSSNENTAVKNYHIEVEKRNKKKFLILIYIISLLESLDEDVSSLLYYYELYDVPKEEKYIKGWLIERKTCFIFFVPIFAYLILHTEIHRHHYLALIFGCFGSICVNVSRFILGCSSIEDFPFHLLNMLLSLIYSLSLVLIKYIMIKYVFLSPYIFLLYDGIFNIINSILLILLQYIIVINLPESNKKKNSLGNVNYFNDNFFQIIKIFIGQESEFYLNFFLSFILSFFYYIIYTLVIYNNSPFLIILIEAFLPLDSDFIRLIFNSQKTYIVNDKDNILERFYYQSFGYVFLFFGSLILNEIIVFNFCGLNDFTFKKMSERAKSDVIDYPELELTNIDDVSYVEEKED
jgi:hypothetical protein